MADWKHKEATWIHNEGNSTLFHEWLNRQCKGGWEVVKIARDFNSYGNPTWCVFRRKSS